VVLASTGAATSLFAASSVSADVLYCCQSVRPRPLVAPLWQQRNAASDLMAVAAQSRHSDAAGRVSRVYRDVFDLPAVQVFGGDSARRDSVTHVESEKAFAFAASLLFSYVANYIYEATLRWPSVARRRFR